MTRAAVGISLMLDDASRAAALPLFEAGRIEALEWSFDQGWHRGGEPAWAAALLDHFAAAGRLWGHGVALSPGSADPGPRHDTWLARIPAELARRPYCGVSEHLGFMVAGDRDGGAPLPLPGGPGAVAVLVRTLARLAAAAGTPVGLENLALALGIDDVWAQGPVLGAVLDAVDGYLVLDVHNLWCQLVNFDVDAAALLATYPLRRVRCIHVAGGGTWAVPGTATHFRRDTHDDDVPDGVFALLAEVLPRCPAVEVVVLERIGGSIRSAAAAERWRGDFERVRAVVEAVPMGTAADASADVGAVTGTLDERGLAAWQRALLDALLSSQTPTDVRAQLQAALPQASAYIDAVDDRALAVALDLMRRWSPQAPPHERG